MITEKAPAPLTARQAEVLGKIRDFYRANGYPPTFRILVKLIDVSNTNAVNVHMIPLVRKGALRRIVMGGTSRYLPVVPEGCCPCCGRPG